MALVLALVLLAVACSSSGDEAAEPTGQEGSAVVVDVSDDLGDQLVDVGTVISGGALPVVAHGAGSRSARVHVITSGSDEMSALPELPEPVWFTAAHSVATERWIFVSAGTCPEPTGEDDIGSVCGDGKSSAGFYAFDRVAETWVVIPYPDNVGNVAEPINIVGDTVHLIATAALDGARRHHATIDLASDHPELTRQDDVSTDVTCSGHQVPPASFDSAEAPTSITLTALGADEARTAPLPPDALPTGTSLLAAHCFTAGEYLLTVNPEAAFGDGDEQREGEGDPTAPLPSDGGGGVSLDATPYRVFAPLRGPEAIYEGRGFVNSFRAGERFFAVQTLTETVIVTADGQEVDRLRADGPHRVRTLPDAVVVVLLNDRGGLQSIEMTPVEA